MSRYRRRFLQTLAGGSVLLAGCTELAAVDGDAGRSPPQGDDTSDGSSETDESDELTEQADSRTLATNPTVVEFETAPLTAAVTGRVRTADGLMMALDFDEPATSSSPATLTAIIANMRSYEQTFEPDRLVVLDEPVASRSPGDRDAVYLAPAEAHPLAETTPEYDRDDDGRWRLTGPSGDWFPETITLEADQRISAEYYLLGHHQPGTQPIEDRRYRFNYGESSFEIAIWPTEQPGPNGDSTFAGTTVPPLPDRDDVRWYHEATPETPVFLEPSRESVTVPARIEFSLVNHARERLSGNPYQWRLYKLVDGAWHHIAPWMIPQPLSRVTPGAIDDSELVVYAGEPITHQGERTVGFLGGGQYAYTVGYSVDSETHAALVELDAPDLHVDPEADAVVDDARSDGTERVVRLPNYADARRPATVTVSRVGSPSAGAASTADARVIPEQLPRPSFRAFRNSLPLFGDDVERVQVRTDRSTALRWFDFEADTTRTIAYEGDLFEATASLEST
ncbi:hypothetical protein [Natrialba aegyptia]|uniref:Uncharacterized protein n=1 Tax=Natrialba aegyptia DSM 13077 TaxID=1227491 RepID=M0B7P2_9EURY|nr:hypothetical protein [Natrialba aegyptia]ELZ06502.1 hypothetical protein C480_09195 [Natrialba aegyptia DSM 13077]